MFVVIAGGGQTGSQLAIMLLEQNHKVRMVENRRDILTRIHRELPTEVIYEGNPLIPESLENAGIREAQVFAAVTSQDEQNLAMCYFARARYKVPRTIARVNSPRNAWLYNQLFHVDVAVNQAALMAALIEEEMSMGEMTVLLKLKRGNLTLVEENVAPGAPAVGIPIRDLGLPEHVIIAAVLRGGEAIIPSGMLKLQPGDEVLAVANADQSGDLRRLFSRQV